MFSLENQNNAIFYYIYGKFKTCSYNTTFIKQVKHVNSLNIVSIKILKEY